MILDNFDITWSKEFKDFAFWALLNSNEAEIASEWLFYLYCSHGSITLFDHDPTEAELEVYEKQVSALINKSKELKMIRKWFKHVQEANYLYTLHTLVQEWP